MVKVYVFLADGFEEIEALGPVDILRRAGAKVTMVSIMPSKEVTAAHGVTVVADAMFADTDLNDADLLFLPGGGSGAQRLNEHEGVRKAVLCQYDCGRYVAAICAAPKVFGSIGILKGKRATIYPGLEECLTGAQHVVATHVIDGNIVTGYGPAAVLPFAYTLVELLFGKGKREEIENDMVYPQLFK